MTTRQLDDERLEVYAIALQVAALCHRLCRDLAAGSAHLADQLRRSSTSIVLNIAEGAGEVSPAEKARFYRMARGSATEAAATLDVMKLAEATQEDLGSVKARIVDVVAMLVRLCTSLEVREGKGKGMGMGKGGA